MNIMFKSLGRVGTWSAYNDGVLLAYELKWHKNGHARLLSAVHDSTMVRKLPRGTLSEAKAVAASIIAMEIANG